MDAGFSLAICEDVRSNAPLKPAFPSLPFPSPSPGPMVYLPNACSRSADDNEMSIGEVGDARSRAVVSCNIRDATQSSDCGTGDTFQQ